MLNGVHSLLVFRALKLGDMLCAVPALRALRQALPSARITLCALPWTETLVRRFPDYVDELLPFPGYPGLPERVVDVAQIPDFLAHVQSLRLDLAVQMHGDGTITNPLVALFGARRTAGFRRPGAYAPDTDLYMSYPENEPEIWRLLRLTALLGAPSRDERLEFRLTAHDRTELGRCPDVAELRRGTYACVHPGASVASRCWEPEGFAAVADGLAARGLEVVVTGGAAERDLVEEVCALSRSRPRRFINDSDIGVLAALLEGARLVVCNDTGVSHLACALGRPSVVVFWGSEQQGWAPRDRIRHRVVASLGGATPDEVLAESDGLLERRDEACGP